MIVRSDLNLGITGLTCRPGEYYCIDFVAYHMGVEARRDKITDALSTNTNHPDRGLVIIYWKGALSDHFGILINPITAISKGQSSVHVREHGIYEFDELEFDYTPRITYHMPIGSAKENIERFLQTV